MSDELRDILDMADKCKEYTIPLMLTVKATDFDDAMKVAGLVAQGLGDTGENVYVPHSFELDNENQRVYYLPPTDETDDERDHRETLPGSDALEDISHKTDPIIGFGQDDEFPSVAAGEPVRQSDLAFSDSGCGHNNTLVNLEGNIECLDCGKIWDK
jgi:hypothetical protein